MAGQDPSPPRAFVETHAASPPLGLEGLVGLVVGLVVRRPQPLSTRDARAGELLESLDIIRGKRRARRGVDRHAARDDERA